MRKMVVLEMIAKNFDRVSVAFDNHQNTAILKHMLKQSKKDFRAHHSKFESPYFKTLENETTTKCAIHLRKCILKSTEKEHVCLNVHFMWKAVNMY